MAEYLIPITIERLEEGLFLATSPLLQGLIAQGRTMAETLEIAEDVARKLIESCIERHDPLPKGLLPLKKVRTKFDVRIPVPVET